MSSQHLNHLHLDVVGGIAGDMFVAAILDLQPEQGQELPLLRRREHHRVDTLRR